MSPISILDRNSLDPRPLDETAAWIGAQRAARSARPDAPDAMPRAEGRKAAETKGGSRDDR
jgi:hypothetical protein